MVNWDNAPDWAMWHAFDKNGDGWWFEKKPFHSEIAWYLHHEGRAEYNIRQEVKTAFISWRDSLTRRPSIKSATTSDGSTASYYTLPANATQLQDLISERNMNAQIGEIFRAAYRYGMDHHSSRIRDIKKIIFYAQAELERLEKLGGVDD